MQLEMLEPKDDRRGRLVEAFKFPNDGQVFCVIAEPDETRGNHYHKRKTETFLVIEGTATMRVRDRLTGNLMKVEVSGDKPLSIKVTPNNTHSITAGEHGAVFLVWVDEVFNEDDPDTIPEEV
jgi:UDP-2-acetamido-2,6-beta-L-arabino-hexul-4-ose reductase